ncbi:MAG: response regulator [Candidatus Taylorbacteria bacterium]|nr:response regulator [Candidatus Taylorbacteria bacterium]
MEEKKLSVLYVDDDPFLLDMYGLKFTKNGYDITTLPSATDALKKIREGTLKPDILLLDIVMPVMDGLVLLTNIRKENLLKDAVVIMLTNQGGASDIDTAKALGAAGYIVKATSIPSEVVEKVKKIYNNVKK